MPTQLESWNDGATKSAIIDFVTRVTTPNGPDFVPPADRIATFDNDGTLWCEKPMYIQLDFILRRWVEMANENPALGAQQPWKAAVERDYAWLGNAVTKHYRGDDSDMPAVMKGVLTAFAGVTSEEFAARAGDLFAHAVASDFETVVQYLRLCAHDRAAALSGSQCIHQLHRVGRRAGLHAPDHPGALWYSPERVVGSSVALEFRENGDGGDVLTQPHLAVLDDGPAKPPSIWSRIGKRPILAAGNSNGDIQMLQFANQPPRPALRLLVLHDDAAREFDYVAGAEKSLELAKQYGWSIVSMKNDLADRVCIES